MQACGEGSSGDRDVASETLISASVCCLSSAAEIRRRGRVAGIRSSVVHPVLERSTSRALVGRRAVVGVDEDEVRRSTKPEQNRADHERKRHPPPHGG